MSLKSDAFGVFKPASIVVGMGLSILCSACSLSFPLHGFVDSAPTGSIKDGGSTPVLSSSLDREDLRRANAALAVALDPQGNGTNVAWANPETGAGGSFVALAPPFPDHDGICRAFEGDLAVHAKPNRKIKGSACRTTSSDWSIADLKDKT